MTNFKFTSKKIDGVMVVLGFKCFFAFFVMKNSKFQKKYFLKVTLELGNVHS